MITRIKIHSAYKSFFHELEHNIDLVTYADALIYLNSSNRKFSNYINSSQLDLIDETFCLLDKNKNVITEQDLWIKKIKEGDSFYLVPAFVGGGGKTGKYLMFAALAAAAIYTGGASAGLGMSPGAMGGATSAGTAFTAAGGGAAGLSAGASMAWAGLGTVGQTLAVNAGLALATSLFTKRPKNNKQTDQDVRQNNMFGSLRATVDSGMPIPLIYGLHRVAGQLISGYLDSTVHGKNNSPTVQSRF